MKQTKVMPATQEVIDILANNPDKRFYINELIRLTGRYPNSIQMAVKTLEANGQVTTLVRGKRKYINLVRRQKSWSWDRRDKASVKWVKLLNRKVNLGFNAAVCRSNWDLLPNLYGVSVPTFWANGITGGVYYIQAELKGLGQKIAEKLSQDPDFAKKDIYSCRKAMRQLLQTSQRLYYKDYSNCGDSILLKGLRIFYRDYLALFPYMTTPHAVERYFETRIREAVSDEAIAQTLMEPVLVRDPVVERGLEIAELVSRAVTSEEAKQAIESYTQEYSYLSMFSVVDQPLPIAYFESEVANLRERFPDPGLERRRLIEAEKTLIFNLEETLARLKASQELSKTVWLLQEYIRLRTERKNAFCQSHYYHRPLLEAIAKRFDWSLDQLGLLRYEEMLGLLGHKSGYESELWLKEIKSRQQGWALLMNEGKLQVISGPREIVETIERLRIVQPLESTSSELRGRPASLGFARGVVKVVRGVEDLVKVKKGDVLVARMTTPDFVPAMRRVVAIVTDEGGITCHAAIVARELGVPCVIATGRATEVLRDGQEVEVDADQGVVRITPRLAVTNQTLWLGQGVYPGKVKAQVRLVEGVADFGAVAKGDIVVCSQASPEYLSVLYRVSGLIIDEDSLSGHGVVYARALRIPCVMGTGDARKGLLDGQMVELDGGLGLVRVDPNGTKGIEKLGK